MVRVEIIRDVAVLAGPGLERLQLALRLAHVAVEVVEVAQVLGLGAGVRVGRVKPLVMLDEHEHAVLACLLQQCEVVREQLRGGLGDQHVDLALDGVQSNGEMGRVGGENGDGGARLQGVNGGLVGIGVGLVVGGIGIKRGIQSVVYLRNVLVQVVACTPVSINTTSRPLLSHFRLRLTDAWELGARDSHHAQLADLASSSQVKQRQSNYADLLVRAGGSTTHVARGVLAGTNLVAYSALNQYNSNKQSTYHQNTGSHLVSPLLSQLSKADLMITGSFGKEIGCARAMRREEKRTT